MRLDYTIGDLSLWKFSTLGGYATVHCSCTYMDGMIFHPFIQYFSHIRTMGG